MYILDLKFAINFLCTVYYSIHAVFVVFLIFFHVIALSKVSTSSTDYTAIILLSVLTHLKSEKAKVKVNESESRTMCQRGFRDNWQTGKPHRFPFLAEVADCASLDLL